MEMDIIGGPKRNRPEPPARSVRTAGFAAMWAQYNDERRHKEFARYLVQSGRINEGEREP